MYGRASELGQPGPPLRQPGWVQFVGVGVRSLEATLRFSLSSKIPSTCDLSPEILEGCDNRMAHQVKKDRGGADKSRFCIVQEAHFAVFILRLRGR